MIKARPLSTRGRIKCCDSATSAKANNTSSSAERTLVSFKADKMNARALRAPRAAKPISNFSINSCVENLGLVLFQLRGDVALAVGEGLFAHVVVGHRLEVGLRDFNVVAEDPVVSHFKRMDAGALPLCLPRNGRSIPWRELRSRESRRAPHRSRHE